MKEITLIEFIENKLLKHQDNLKNIVMCYLSEETFVKFKYQIYDEPKYQEKIGIVSSSEIEYDNILFILNHNVGSNHILFMNPCNGSLSIPIPKYVN